MRSLVLEMTHRSLTFSASAIGEDQFSCSCVRWNARRNVWPRIRAFGPVNPGVFESPAGGWCDVVSKKQSISKAVLYRLW